jgi:hypothetical protein
MSFLEQVVSEYYQHRGYYVRVNVHALKRSKGGYDGELDVLAFEPKQRVLVHVETSWDSDTWEEREEKFKRKFRYDDSQYRAILRLPMREVKRRAVIGGALSVPTHVHWLGIEILTVPLLFREIGRYLDDKHPSRRVVPENLLCLRSIQFFKYFGEGTQTDTG